MENLNEEKMRKLIYADIEAMKTQHSLREDAGIKRSGGVMINCSGEVDIPDEVIVPSDEFTNRPA